MSKELAELKLQEALLTTYLANLDFLKIYDNDLYKRVNILSEMIDSGMYKEKYHLEFIQENGDFDIYDVVNDKYLYERNPKKWNDNKVEEIKFDEENAINALEKSLYTGRTFDIEEDERYFLEDLDYANSLTMNNVSEYVNGFDLANSVKKRKLKKIKKFIFFGTLLGRHISRISQKIDSEAYFVCEKNIEIFRLSLFTTDYSILAKRKIPIFSIMEDKIEFENKVNKFLDILPFDNHILKLSSTNININEFIDYFLATLIHTKPTIFDYNRILYSFVRNVSEKLSGQHKILLLNQIQQKCNIFDGKEVLFLAAGPSLNDSIHWIKENQDKFFIVTVGAAYKRLVKNSIKIDMLITLDPQYSVLDECQFDEESVKSLHDTIVLASIVTDDRILKRFNQNKLFIYECFSSFYKGNKIIQCASVGEMSVGLLLNMNVKELYIIGLDLALNKDTGVTHDLGEAGIKNFKDDIKKNSKEIFGLKTGVIEVKGNKEKKVFTTGLFNTSIIHLNNILTEKNQEVNIYNLSNHGAFFENTIPKNLDEVNINEKKKQIVDEYSLLSLMNKNSKSVLSDNEYDGIRREIMYVKTKVLKELEDLNLKNFKTYDEFIKSREEFLLRIIKSKEKNDILAGIFINYSQVIYPYLNYCFNFIKIKDEHKKVNRLKDIMIEQTSRMFNDYIMYLEKIVESK